MWQNTINVAWLEPQGRWAYQSERMKINTAPQIRLLKYIENKYKHLTRIYTKIHAEYQEEPREKQKSEQQNITRAEQFGTEDQTMRNKNLVTVTMVSLTFNQ